MNNINRSNGDSRKQAVSIRMSRNDVRHIKRLAERLGARDSDVIRFAIKLMLAKVAPLQDLSVRGRSLVPVFLEAVPDLMRHFDLDAAKLAAIINDGVEEDRRVDPDDVHLIAMSGIQRSYMKLQVAGFRRAIAAGDVGNGGAGEAHKLDARAADEGSADQSLRQYLYEKYLFAKSSPSQSVDPGRGP